MDTLSHSLWGYGLFGFRGRPWIALLSGALPDLIPFGLMTIYLLMTGAYVPGKPELDIIPSWTFVLYDMTHSLVIAAVIIALIYSRWKTIGFAMLAWVFHIFLDIPFHTKAYFPTKMFWPISDVVVDGIVWSTPWIWFPNLAGIFILLCFRAYQKAKGD